MINTKTFTQPSSETVAKRIRALRKARGWTLHDVERLSSGSIKAVVMGSYERGSRALSLARTIEIADLFGLPLANLLGDFSGKDVLNLQSLTIDQRRLSEMAEKTIDPKITALNSFIGAIANRRGDWNGEVLTLRGSDFDTLTLVFELPLADLKQWLLQERLILVALK